MAKRQSIWKRSFTERNPRIKLHITFWIIYFFFFCSFSMVLSTSQNSEAGGSIVAGIFFGLLFNIPIICLSYYLTIQTVYKYIKQKRFLLSFISLLLCIFVFTQLFYLGMVCFIKLDAIFDLQMNNTSQIYADAIKRNGYAFFTNPLVWIQMTISYFVLIAPPVGARIFRDQLRLQQHKNRLEKENMKLQMDFLKAQIHPHFLFNTLNNIYSLISHHESEKSAEMVSDLSALLRYALYEGKAEFISLEKEIEMLKDYISLEEARTDEIDLEIEIPSNDYLSEIKLPPFLLLPLVENAFKHGVNSQFQKSSLKIKIEISSKSVQLFVQNNFDVAFRKKNEGGLGLFNLKKRLAYYYKDCHRLSTEEKDNIFTATLKLPRSCPQSKASS